ncbi:MAG: VIT domain-containing protein, partial [Planctomycetota bacterium]|nr:VIT domain-containing protein [Planctomycetota bacterium]
MGQQELDSIQASETAPGLKTARGNLPLKAMDVDAGITSLLAQTKVRQTFVNNHDDPIEATYIFPLPDRAAVTSFKMKAADRVIDGQIKERGEARRDYEEALRTGHRASLAEEDRPDVFTMQVGNIMPGEQVEVELELNGPLSINSNEATYRFPLVVAPRYIPGERILGPSAGDGVVEDTKAVPDASRITPPVLLPG